MLLLFASIFLSSCSTQSYIAQSSYPTDPMSRTGLIAAKTALERPVITPQEITEEIFINRAKTFEELEKNTFVSNFDRAVNNIIIEAKTFLGTPYRYGGVTRRGIDCSAFMQQIFDVEGIDLPRQSIHQAKTGKAVSRAELQKGDLIFFSTTSPYRITHVGMVTEVEDGEITFIHSASSKGVTFESLNHPYWDARYRAGRRPDKFVQPKYITTAEMDSLEQIAANR
ncbi:MAG: NlpC/P60 family protein [Flavobacteriaceae bacterium]|nr:NlpC/P60 family protein [Flavobacteriaceae bacterium]